MTENSTPDPSSSVAHNRRNRFGSHGLGMAARRLEQLPT